MCAYTGKKTIVIAGTLAALFALSGCEHVEAWLSSLKEAPPAPAAEARPPIPKKFTPPADSAVSERQFAAWKECNILLDSLTFYYAKSFKSADPVQTLRLQEDFLKAKDRICRRAGLAGGHDEYKWIGAVIENPKNWELLGQ